MIPFRDENPTRIVPYVTYGLIFANLLVFLLEITGGIYDTQQGFMGGYLAGWTLVPYELTHNRDIAINGPTLQPIFLTVFTAMFMHSGWLHFVGNMLFLFIFGNNIEDALGHVKFLAFYLLCGMTAALTQVAYSPDSPIPTLGASGAIAGVLGAYLVLFPKAKVHTLIFLGIFITTVRLPAFVLLGFWIVTQFFSQWTEMLRPVQEANGSVAYLAHIGGFIIGMILIKLFGANPTPPGYDGGYRAREIPPRYFIPKR